VIEISGGERSMWLTPPIGGINSSLKEMYNIHIGFPGTFITFFLLKWKGSYSKWLRTYIHMYSFSMLMQCFSNTHTSSKASPVKPREN